MWDAAPYKKDCLYLNELTWLFDNNLLATDDVHALGQTLERFAGIAHLDTIDCVNIVVDHLDLCLDIADAVHNACCIYVDVVDVATVGVGDNNIRQYIVCQFTGNGDFEYIISCGNSTSYFRSVDGQCHAACVGCLVRLYTHCDLRTGLDVRYGERIVLAANPEVGRTFVCAESCLRVVYSCGQCACGHCVEQQTLWQ